MKKTTLLILFEMIVMSTSAQTKPLIKIDSGLAYPRLKTIFIEPISLIDPDGESFRLGTEHRLYKNWALSVTGGVYFDRAKGTMAKGELKRYIHANKSGKNSFVSFELFYKQIRNRLSDSITIAPDYKTDYTMSTFVTGYRIKYGVLTTLAHHLIIETYIGAGVRYRNATSTLTPDEYAHIKYNVDDQTLSRYMYAVSKTIRPDISLGIRFGFRY